MCVIKKHKIIFNKFNIFNFLFNMDSKMKNCITQIIYKNYSIYELFKFPIKIVLDKKSYIWILCNSLSLKFKKIFKSINFSYSVYFLF